MTDVIGSASFELRATRNQLLKDTEAAEKDLLKSVDRIEKKYAKGGEDAASAFGKGTGKMAGHADDAARAVGKSSGLMVAALGGVATAVASIGFGGLLEGARDAAAAGAQIQKTADSLNIGVERLQELRYAADETKVPISDLEGGLGRLNVLLGQFRAGMVSRELKPTFDALGIKPEDLQSIENADQFMGLLADKIRLAGTEAEQAALLDKLQIADLLPLLQRGSDGIDDMANAASNLGGVLSADMIAKLAEADTQMQHSGDQLDQLRIAAFAPLAIAVGNASEQVTGFIVQMNGVQQRAPGWIRAISGALNALPGGPAIGALFGRLMDRPGDDAPDAQGNIYRRKAGGSDNPVGGYVPTAPRTPRAGGGRQVRDTSAADAQRLARVREDMEASVALTEAKLSRNLEQVAVLEREAEIRQRIRSLEAAGVAPAVAQQEASALQLRIDEARAKVKEEEAKEQAEAITSGERQHAIEVARLSGQSDRLHILQDEEDLADRVAYWTRITLDADKARLIAQREMKEIGEARATAAQREASAANRRRALELAEARGDRPEATRLSRDEEISRRAEALVKGNGTLSLGDATKQASDEVDELIDAVREGDLRESFRHEFADGMRAAIDGDLGGYFENLADRFTDRMLDNLADDLFDMLKGAGGGAKGGNWLSSIFSFFGNIGSNATGTSSWRGGLTRINEMGGEILNLPGGTQIIPHDVSMRMAAGAAAGGQAPITFDLRGAVMTKDLLQQMQGMAAQSGGGAVEVSRKVIPAEQDRRARYRY